MLLLRKELVTVDQNTIEIPNLDALPFEKSIRKELLLCLAGNDTVRKFRVTGCSKIPKAQGKSKFTIRIQTADEGKVPFHARLNGVLLKRDCAVEMDDALFESFLAASAVFDVPAVTLHLKEKQDQYLRLLWVDQSSRIFLEKYIPWKDWKIYRQTFAETKDAMDHEIQLKDKKGIDRHQSLLKDKLKRMLSKAGLPVDGLLDSRENEWRRVAVYWDAFSCFIPFELLDDRLLVVHYLPAVPHKDRHSEDRLTIIHTKGLGQSAGESSQVFQRLEKLFPVESFSDEFYRDYQSNLNLSTFLHFAGHGGEDGRESWLLIDGEPKKSLNYSGNLRLAVLNACKAGVCSGGIISSLFENGIQAVIATPYSITDGESAISAKSLQDFYEFFDPEDFEASYIMGTLKNHVLRKYYRLFMSYFNKI